MVAEAAATLPLSWSPLPPVVAQNVGLNKLVDGDRGVVGDDGTDEAVDVSL